jgi:hypothetical protein
VYPTGASTKLEYGPRIRKTVVIMQKKKRNHFVPQGYLRTFAADPRRRKVWTFKKSGGDFELRPIKKVATSFYLYAPQGQEGRDYTFEDKLASLEQLFGEQFWHVLATDFVDLGSDTIRKGVSLLTAVMFLRNPAIFEFHRRLHRQMVDFYSARPVLPDAIEINGRVYECDASDWPEFRSAEDDDIKRMWLTELGGAVWLAEELINMRWSIIVSDEPVFVTSDNPVSLLHPSLDFKGFKNPETLVTFPISPTRILCLDNKTSEPDCQYYPLKGSPGAINSMIWRYSNDTIFSHRHVGLVCQEMCDDAEHMGFTWREGGWVGSAS